MAEEIEIPYFKIDTKEIANQFMIVLQRGGASDLIDHLREVMMDMISRADKPEVFYPILRVLTILHDGKAPKAVPPPISQHGTGASQTAQAKNVSEDPSIDILPPGSKEILCKIREYGFLDENLKLLPDTTRSEAMYIVFRICKLLGYDKIKWRPFERYWGMKNLAQERWKWVNRNWISPRVTEIDDAIASDDGL